MRHIRTYKWKGFWLLPEMILTGTVDLPVFLTRWSIYRTYGNKKHEGREVHSRNSSFLGIKYRKYFFPSEDVIEARQNAVVSCSWITSNGKRQTLTGKFKEMEPQMAKLKRMYPSEYETLIIVPCK